MVSLDKCVNKRSMSKAEARFPEKLFDVSLLKEDGSGSGTEWEDSSSRAIRDEGC